MSNGRRDSTESCEGAAGDRENTLVSYEVEGNGNERADEKCSRDQNDSTQTLGEVAHVSESYWRNESDLR